MHFYDSITLGSQGFFLIDVSKNKNFKLRIKNKFPIREHHNFGHSKENSDIAG